MRILIAEDDAVLADGLSRSLKAGGYGWGHMALYGVLTLGAYVLVNRGLGKLPTALVAVLGYGQPVVATALGLHQKTTDRQNRQAAGTWKQYAADRCPNETREREDYSR